MVTTSMASPLAASPLLVNDEAPARRHEPARSALTAPAVACSILTPSGALLARAMVKPRPASLPEDAYAVELSEVEPRGALEPLLKTNPQVVLRTPHEAQLALRIDHIIGPRERRTYFLQTLASGSD